MLIDPYGWHSEAEAWEMQYGKDRVFYFPTNQTSVFGPACDRYYQHVQEKSLTAIPATRH